MPAAWLPCGVDACSLTVLWCGCLQPDCPVVWMPAAWLSCGVDACSLTALWCGCLQPDCSVVWMPAAWLPCGVDACSPTILWCGCLQPDCPVVWMPAAWLSLYLSRSLPWCALLRTGPQGTSTGRGRGGGGFCGGLAADILLQFYSLNILWLHVICIVFTES